MVQEEQFQHSTFSLSEILFERLIQVEIVHPIVIELTRHHYETCQEYQILIDKLGLDIDNCDSVEDLPFLPVSLFKEYQLMSVERDEVVQVLTSSGTSNDALSNIYLDRENATNQKRALVNIVTEETGNERVPMLIICLLYTSDAADE